MGEVIELRSRSRRVEEACEWLARVDRGLSQSESQALTRWLTLDRRNESALRQACGIWDRLDGLRLLGSAFPARQASTARRRLQGAASILLVVLACVAGAWLASSTPPAPPESLVPSPR